MSDFVSQVLQSSGLTDLLQKFKDNDIDEDVLRRLADCKTGSPEETLFAVVVSSIGQRIKIISAVREVSAKGAVDRPCPHIPENIQNITEMEVEDVVEIGSVQQQRVIEDQQRMLEIILLDREGNNLEPNENNNEDETTTSSIFAEQEILLSPSDLQFNIKEIILQADRDKGVNKGEKTLEECAKLRLASFDFDFIKRRTVNYLVKNFSNYPPRHVKQNLAGCIATQIFGHLSESQQLDINNLFYSDAKKIKISLTDEQGNFVFKTKPATGLIENRLKYLRKKNKITIRGNKTVTNISPLGTPVEEDYEKKSWLENSKGPSTQIIQYMEDTFNLRSVEIKNSTNLSDTLKDWPHLLETSGVNAPPTFLAGKLTTVANEISLGGKLKRLPRK
ncbi:hypothetical protein Fcan01_27470 [Folsomia candida]|uniref:Uncharacterized protein n=1 Tax=Folsomia candida TaxID=158441 RepID=A0A226D0E2_FOLCA|nr:hypothetical protein Fcan01_27470 [Folsomia candida]